MPGLFGVVSLNKSVPQSDSSLMCSELKYGRAIVEEWYRDGGIEIGCVHLGTGGQRTLYQSAEAVVVFFGYLTQPSLPPGADPAHLCEAAHYVHDLYITEGEGLMHGLAGAFAIVIWDKRTHSLLLISDFLGLRPIYYSFHNSTFRFASEVKGILADPSFPHRINRTAFAEFFYFGHILEEKTFFEDIQLVPSASILRLREGHIDVTSYWKITFPDRYPYRTDEWYDHLINNAIQASVKRMIRPGLKYGLSLSGGLDSRWIAGYLAEYQPNSLAFTVGIPGSDDTLIADQVAHQTSLSHHYWNLSTSYFAELGEMYAYIVDGMDSLDNMGEFPLSLRVGNYADISVGGLLGGPAFGYYIDPLSAHLRRKDVLRYFLWRTKTERLPSQAMEQVFQPGVGQELATTAIDSARKCIDAAPYQLGFNAFQYFVLKRHQNRSVILAQLAKLAFVDIYHPLADQEVIAAASQLPASQLVVEEAYRRAFVHYFPKLGEIPWTYTLTPPSISVHAAILKKIAQHTLGQWLRNTPLGDHPLIRPRRYYTNHSRWSRGPARPFIEATLLSPEANASGFFNPNGLRTVVREHMDGKRDFMGFIGRALAVALWTRFFYTPSTPIRSSMLVDYQQ